MPGFRKFVAVAALGLGVGGSLFSAAPAAAQPEDPPQGTTCAKRPEFSFTWLDTEVAELEVKAEEEQQFVITLEYLKPITTDEPVLLQGIPGAGKSARSNCWAETKAASKEVAELLVASGAPEDGREARREGEKVSPQPITFCVNASPKGVGVPLFLDREAVLRGGGFVHVTFEGTGEYPVSCEANRTGSIKVKAMQKHRLSFDIGPTFNLGGDGSWASNMEAALTARSDWYTWFEGDVNIRYSAIGAVGEDPGDSGDAEEDSDPPAGGNGGNDQNFNPFEEGGGVFETNISGIVRSPRVPWLGLAVGVGLSSVPGEANSRLETRERTFGAVRISAQGYNAGEPAETLGNSLGFIQAGYAQNDLWERVELEPASEDGSRNAVFSDESKRWFLEGELELPRVGTDWARLLLRLFVSVPKSGNGPSDIRASALISVDPRKWFPGLRSGGGDED
jgi:hypothetical protein